MFGCYYLGIVTFSFDYFGDCLIWVSKHLLMLRCIGVFCCLCLFSLWVFGYSVGLGWFWVGCVCGLELEVCFGRLPGVTVGCIALLVICVGFNWLLVFFKLMIVSFSWELGLCVVDAMLYAFCLFCLD